MNADSVNGPKLRMCFEPTHYIVSGLLTIFVHFSQHSSMNHLVFRQIVVKTSFCNSTSAEMFYCFLGSFCPCPAKTAEPPWFTYVIQPNFHQFPRISRFVFLRRQI